MRRSLILTLPVLALVLSCGTYAEYSSGQRYADGIYTRYSAAAESRPLYTVDDFDAMARRNLAAKQKAAGAARDTVYVILEDYRADYAWNAPWAFGVWGVHSWYYRPWYYESWAWRDPWFYDPWYYDPWYYRPYRPYYPYPGYLPAPSRPRHTDGPHFGGGHGSRRPSSSGQYVGGSSLTRG